MSHTPLLDKLKAAREDILKGEVGALLHDIGKLDPRFPKSKSKEGGVSFSHEDIKKEKVVTDELIALLDSVYMNIKNERTSLLTLTRKHGQRKRQKKLISTLSKCDGIDSGDDKGVVRRKQPINNTVIVSAFGKEKSKIDLTRLNNYLKELDKNLKHIFSLYINRKIDIHCFRDSVLESIKEPFSNSLGETRIPANDVTLYDHSFSTASLYKTQLARAVLEGKVEGTEEWRVFGLFWNGTRFVSQAKKVADALKRQEIIESIREKLKRIFEVEYTIGNAIFEDNDSIFFTFPAFHDSEELAAECMEKAVEVIRKESDNDLWPIFALSQSRRSPTVIAQMMEFFDGKKGIEKESPVLCIQDKNSEFLPYTTLENPTLEIPEYKNEKYDICPVCRIRAKKEKHKTCDVCFRRRRGRITDWVGNRDNSETIWIDEVADENNRVALVSLEFDIGDWMDGTFVNTLFSQSFEDWASNKKFDKHSLDRPKEHLKEALEHLRFVLDKNKDKKERAKRLDIFFEDLDVSEENLDIHLANIAKKFGKNVDDLTENDLFNYLFHKQPSPARLRRIWRETEDFIEEVQKQIHAVVKWPKRIVIEVEEEPARWDDFSTGKITELVNLSPDNLPVTYLGDRKFITITSFEGYKAKSDGLKGVKKFLNQNIGKELKIKKDDSYNEKEKEQKIKITKIKPESRTYIPTITITKSPYQFQMLVPATSVPRVLEIVTSLYDDWFSKVKGKLPLKLGILVANRKFPLYVLLDSASKMLKGKQFRKPISMEPYWDVNELSSDPYYGYYPTAPPEDIPPEKLVPIKNGRKFYLSPGYFDFDFLGGTGDRGRIFYSGKNDSKPQRESIEYGRIKPRPYYFYEIKRILKLRDILGELTKTQVNGIERALIAKLEEWKDVDSDNKNEVFREFAKAVIIDAFKPKKWWKMSSEKRGFIEDAIKSGLLLDTIQLFNHVLKTKIGGDKDE